MTKLTEKIKGALSIHSHGGDSSDSEPEDVVQTPRAVETTEPVLTPAQQVAVAASDGPSRTAEDDVMSISSVSTSMTQKEEKRATKWRAAFAEHDMSPDASDELILCERYRKLPALPTNLSAIDIQCALQDPILIQGRFYVSRSQ
jgi:hypothetical protein